MLETLIARRPIFNDARKLVGYELLTRGVGEAGGEGELSALMLARALGDVGWEPVVGAHVAWVDASHELAREPEAPAELPRPAVLRVPGSAGLDGAALAALDRLRG